MTTIKRVALALALGSSLLGAATAANAGYWTPWGYVVTCSWVYTPYGPMQVCN